MLSSSISGRLGAAVAFMAFLLGMHFVRGLPWIVPAAYAFMSAASFAAYGVDKRRAVRSQRRLSESRLHALEFLGGWPGAFVAQGYFRHKTLKTSYLLPFWFIVVLHLIGWGYYWHAWPSMFRTSI